MENLAIDVNNRNVGGGIIHGTRDTLPLFINPLTGELLVEIHTSTSDGVAIPVRNLNIDENHRNVGGATDEKLAQIIIPLTVNMHLDLPCLRIET